MDQISKILLLNQMIKNYDANVLDIDPLVSEFQNVASNHSTYFKDTTLFDEYISALSEMKKLNEKQKDIRLKKIDRLEELLRKEEVKIFQRDYHTYSYRKVDWVVVKDRQAPIDGFTKELKTTIGYYSDWRWAGVELNPGVGNYTDAMLACDPLYILDTNKSKMNEIQSKFSKRFATTRLFGYASLGELPQNQLGIATSINDYEFMPIDPIKDQMREVYSVLRPGGHFIFTYNDCEKEPGINFCGNGYRCYNTKTLMISLVRSLGFDFVEGKNFLDAHSWMVVKKPGDLTSQKLSAPLVKIVTPKITELQKVRYNSTHERYNKK